MRLIAALWFVAPCLLALACWPFAAPAEASEAAGVCQQAVASAERGTGVPNQLLDAISRVESGRVDAQSGSLRAWPWTINEEGQGHFYNSKAEAVQAAQQFQARGIRSMDIGCAQINLMYHPQAFASLEDAFDPAENALVAARFLTELFHQVGSWPHAAAAYHSQTPELGTDYQHRVLEAWADPIDTPAEHASHGLAARQPEPKLASMIGPGRPLFARSTSRIRGPLVPVRSFERPIGVPLGGLGRIIRTASGPSPFSGRTLMAYRAMPVAMLVARPQTAP